MRPTNINQSKEVHRLNSYLPSIYFSSNQLHIYRHACKLAGDVGGDTCAKTPREAAELPPPKCAYHNAKTNNPSQAR